MTAIYDNSAAFYISGNYSALQLIFVKKKQKADILHKDRDESGDED